MGVSKGVQRRIAARALAKQTKQLSPLAILEAKPHTKSTNNVDINLVEVVDDDLANVPAINNVEIGEILPIVSQTSMETLGWQTSVDSIDSVQTLHDEESINRLFRKSFYNSKLNQNLNNNLRQGNKKHCLKHYLFNDINNIF